MGGARKVSGQSEYRASYAPLRETLTDLINTPIINKEKEKCNTMVQKFFTSYESSYASGGENVQDFLTEEMKKIKEMKCSKLN